MTSVADIAVPCCSSSNEAAQAIRFRRPLVTVSTAMSLINVLWPEEIISMIDDGRLRWAFNISRHADAKSREVRILSNSINSYLLGLDVAPEQPNEFQGVLASIFPDQPAEIRAADIARSFNCGTELIFCLHRDGALKGAGQGSFRSPKYQFASVVEFLRQRRIV
jgi:hypothetical protein